MLAQLITDWPTFTALAGPKRPLPSCLLKRAATAAALQHSQHEVRGR